MALWLVGCEIILPAVKESTIRQQRTLYPIVGKWEADTTL